jgi:hypothetical protein
VKPGGVTFPTRVHPKVAAETKIPFRPKHDHGAKIIGIAIYASGFDRPVGVAAVKNPSNQIVDAVEMKA